MADGKGCVCGAYGECECSCEVDWTPKELIDMRERLAQLESILIRIRASGHNGKCYRAMDAVEDADIDKVLFEQGPAE